MSLLADTGDYGAFRPLPAHAWASARPVPRGVYGDTTPKTPPTISAYRYTHRECMMYPADCRRALAA